MKSGLLKTAIAAALTAGLTFAASASAAGPTIATLTRGTALHHGDAITGALPMTQPIHVVVALKMRDRSGLDAFIAHSAKNRIGGVAQPMSRGTFMANHAPSQAQAEAVARYLVAMGFRNVSISSNRMLVSADGTTKSVGDAFQTNMVKVRTHDGRDAYANSSEARIPAALQDSVLSVIGLQNVHQYHTFAKVLPQGSVHTHAVTGHNPTEFSSIYSGSGVNTAAGVTVGIITQGKLTNVLSDLSKFTTNNGLAAVTTQTVQTGSTSTDTSGDGEWDLDSQDIVGMSGGQVGKIIFYNEGTLSNSDLTANINTVVTRNEAKIINMSLGECETSAQSDGSAAADDQLFATAVSQGQTFSISTGDSGADECGNGGTTPSNPADSPYVVAVAGTTLNASTTTWSSETVWSGSGGSESTFEPKPSWQTLWNGTYRGVADVAFDADPNSGSMVIVDGATQQIGGTSLAAPLFSGLWARVIAAKGTGVGFAGPIIYQLSSADFHDITSGSNGISAGVGYDLASGRGSLKISSAVADVGGGGGGGGGTNNPPTANFSFTTSGDTANFTDSSTDSDGTIASHSWTFGDGGTSTATNPSHTYAADGSYSVTETVTDNGGASASKTSTVTVSSGGGGGGSSNLIVNGGFETGTATPWSMSSSVLSNSSSEPAHGGSWDAWMDGYGSTHTDTVSQKVAIPSGKSSATLSFYLHIDTAETTTSTAYDKLYVRLYSSSGKLLKTLATYSNLNANSGYSVHNLSVSSYIGQTVTVKFTGSEDSSLQTSFVLDDVSLNVQ